MAGSVSRNRVRHCHRRARLAEAAKRAGHPGRLTQIAADLFVGMLDGRFYGLTEAQILAHLLAHPRPEDTDDNPDTDTDTDRDADTERDADTDLGADAEGADETRDVENCREDGAADAAPADSPDGDGSDADPAGGDSVSGDSVSEESASGESAGGELSAADPAEDCSVDEDWADEVAAEEVAAEEVPADQDPANEDAAEESVTDEDPVRTRPALGRGGRPPRQPRHRPRHPPRPAHPVATRPQPGPATPTGTRRPGGATLLNSVRRSAAVLPEIPRFLGSPRSPSSGTGPARPSRPRDGPTGHFTRTHCPAPHSTSGPIPQAGTPRSGAAGGYPDPHGARLRLPQGREGDGGYGERLQLQRNLRPGRIEPVRGGDDGAGHLEPLRPQLAGRALGDGRHGPAGRPGSSRTAPAAA